MRRRSLNSYVVVLLIVDVVTTMICVSLAHRLRLELPYGQPLGRRGSELSLGILPVIALIWPITFRLFRAYDANRILRAVQEYRTVLAATTMATFALSGVLFLLFRDTSRLLFVYFALIELPAILAARALVRIVFKALNAQRITEQRILLVGAGEVGQQMADLLAERRWMGLHVVGFLDDDLQKRNSEVHDVPVLGKLAEVERCVKQYQVDEVIITLPLYAHGPLVRLVSVLNEMTVNVRVVPDFFPLAYLRASVGLLGDMPLITLKEPAISPLSLTGKRALDLALASIALLMLWPLMLAIAAWIKLDSPGPVLFRQQRVGWNGKLFWIFKYRTMRTGSERDWAAIMDKTAEGKPFLRKDRQDPRITRAGAFLRRWSLDELPQLFNVIKGDMSLVGPRPEMPFLVAEYEPGQRKRLCVPPGITGWWQVTERADQPLALHAEADLYYIRNYSLLLDLKILLRTFGAVIRGKGAY